MKRFLQSLLTTLMLLLPTIGWGNMTIRNYSAAKHYRFYAGNDKNFIGESYDFSGVGYSNSGHWATLVSDNYFISATHYHPGVNETITFWTTNDLTDPSYSYTVKDGSRIATTDLWVGWFDTNITVDSSIARYPVLMLPTNNDYVGLELYNYGKPHRVGRNILDHLYYTDDGTLTGLAAWYDYDNNDTPSVGSDETYLQGGDSGAPSFTIVNSSLALIGPHWARTTNPYYSIDTFAPSYFNDVNNILERSGQSLTSSTPTLPFPEPGAFWYLLITSGYLWYQRRRSVSA